MFRVENSKLSIFTSALLFSVLVFSFATSVYAQLACFPTCSPSDGRFLAITEGTLFETLTPSELNIRIIVPSTAESFQIGVFDGDHLANDGGGFHWDNGDLNSPGLYSYNLKVDPDRDNTGVSVLEVMSTELLNNDWVDYQIPNHPGADDGNGNSVYTLTIALLNGVDSLNAFKIRVNPGSAQIEEIFSFVANITGIDDAAIVYPNANFGDGIGPEDLPGNNYDGTFSFNFSIPEDAIEVVFWDGDSDRGDFTGANTDVDDPNTPNLIPPFAPLDSDVVAEGVNPPNPFDDIDPAEFGGFAFFFQKSPSVTYRMIFPDGQEFNNENPSGQREWEQFVISTLTDAPELVDFQTDSIPAGDYEIRFEGLDMGNIVSINPLFPLTLRGEEIPDDSSPMAVPTISEWGLITLVAMFGIIGIYYVRRYKKAVD